MKIFFKNKSDADRFRKNDRVLLENRKEIHEVEEFTTVKGENRISRSIKTLIPSVGGGLPLILGISWDITDLKNAERELIIAKEKAEESNRLKTAFLANMSHEIRTPLNAIIGFSDLLGEMDDKKEREGYINIIKKNNKILLQLISDVLDLSKIEAEIFDFELSDTDVNKLCLDVVVSSELRLHAHIPIIFEDHIPVCVIHTDSSRIHQVLSNMISNALKFTKEGDIRVGYHVINDDTIRFYVKDTGIGIKKEDASSVFDRFVKLNTFAQGNGLGLALCKNIVEQLNGSIGVESEWGKGSCFWFTLPYDKNLQSGL